MKKAHCLIASILFLTALTLIAFHSYDTATSHSASAFDFLEDIVYYGIALVCFIISFFLLRRQKNGSIILLSFVALCVLIAFLINYFFALKENNSPTFLYASDGYSIGGVSLKLRKDSTYRIEGYGGIGMNWHEGKYHILENKLYLNNNDIKQTGLSSELFIKNDSVFSDNNIQLKIKEIYK